MLDLDALCSFVVFARHLNFTHAAQELHISQPALHTKIRKLAEDLGAPLYRRVGRRLELTREGEETLRFGRELQEQTEGFLEELHTGESHQQVTLAAGAGSYLYLLGGAIKAFAQEAKAPPRLLTRSQEGTLEALRLGEAHLGVTSLEEPVASLCCEPLTSVPQLLLCEESSALACKEKIALEDLEGSRLVVPPQGRPHRVALARALLAAGVQWEVAVEAGGWELMLSFVRLGMGMAVVNGICTIPRGFVGRPLPSLPSIHYYLLHRKGSALRGSQARLKELILSLCARWDGDGMRSRQETTTRTSNEEEKR